SIPSRAKAVLGVGPRFEDVVVGASKALRAAGLQVESDAGARVVTAANAIRTKLAGADPRREDVASLKSTPLKRWLAARSSARRVFPQQIYQLLLAEFGVR